MGRFKELHFVTLTIVLIVNIKGRYGNTALQEQSISYECHLDLS